MTHRLNDAESLERARYLAKQGRTAFQIWCEVKGITMHRADMLVWSVNL